MTFVFRNRAWLYLTLAIVLEVCGTITMKIAQTGAGPLSPEAAMTLMYVLIALSYALLALAVTRMPVGVAYAFWEGIGLTAITLISVLVLGEHFSWMRFAALCAVVAGAVLIHHGTAMTEKKPARAKSVRKETSATSTRTNRTASYGRAM